VRKNIDSYLSSSNRARAEHIRTFIQEQIKTAEILSVGVVYRELLKESTTSKLYSEIKQKATKRLISNTQIQKQIIESMIIDSKGKIIASSNPENEGLDKSNDLYFTQAKNGVYIKDLNYSEPNKDLNFAISAPVKDDSGNFIGLSVLVYSPEYFFNIVKNENGLGRTEENFLINKDKYFITPSIFLGNEVILKEKNDTENARNCFSDRLVNYVKENGYSGLNNFLGSNEIIESKDYRNIDVITTHAYIPETSWCLITKADKADLMSFRIDMLKIFAIIFLIAILMYYVIGLFLSKKITRSIKYLRIAAENIKNGNLNYSLIIDTKDEIADVSRAFNDMMISVRESKKEVDAKVAEQTKDINNKALELHGRQIAMLNVLEDIQKEKKNVENLANDLQKFKLAVDNASDQVVITDPEGIVIYGNSTVEKITGFKPEEALGKKAAVLWRLPMPVEYYKKLWDTIKIDKKPFISEIKNKRKNGESYTAMISISPVLNDKGEVIYFVAIERDITERIEAEDQIRKVLNSMQEQAQKLTIEKAKDEAVLAGIGDGVITTNQDGIIAFANNSTMQMLGYASEELIDKPIINIIRTVDENNQDIPLSRRPVIMALSTGEKTVTPSGQSHYYCRKDGSKFPINSTVTPFLFNGKIIGTIEVFRDVTIEKDIDKAKTEFVSLASHQLRTPLSTIGWYSEMLLSGDAGKLNKKQKEFIDEIYIGNKHMIDLVGSLLNVSRIELGTFAVEPTMSDITEISESVLNELKPIILEKKMKVKAIYEKGLEKISLDGKLIRMVFQNLLTNALKYTNEGGSIVLEIKIVKDDLLVSVSDNGYGIPQSQQGEIFTKLFRADNAKANDTSGTGLGLYIIKSIIEKSSGGKIWFESIENKGTTFYFTLPKNGMKPKSGSKPIGV
jgi:PAS domain S-box-containing protein